MPDGDSLPMNWVNLNVATLRSPEFIGCEPVARATWLSILAYCCSQENGGRITACSEWKDRQWQQICGVTYDEVHSAQPLLIWDGTDLIVWQYPADKQAEIQARREAGRRGGLSRSEAKLEAVRANGAKQTQSKGKAQPKQRQSSDQTEREREGEGEIERKEKTDGAEGSAPAVTDSEWLASLSANPAYKTLNVPAEFAKMTSWCSVNNRQPTRRRFVNWLNRCDKPLAPQGVQGEFQSVRSKDW
jgi:hypothetical protein